MKSSSSTTTQGRLHELEETKRTALLVGTYAVGDKQQSSEQLDELESLGDTYGLKTAFKMLCPLREIDAGTYLGSGKIQEIKEMAALHHCDVVIFDDVISPQQQRNIEKLVEKSVIDRTELILAVFAKAAHTKEAKLQIELASCRYQLPRLRRLWTHLSRQRSGGAGGGFVKGEGEKQIEIDKRILKDQITKLKKELEEVKKHRQTQRRLRERSAIPTFAIIGYTNVGKSTLLKALTDADVLVEDKLFATLDTTTRKFVLPNHQQILLIDTVGFIRKIPHALIAAFRSTLEEALSADILLHLVDVSSSNVEVQIEATMDVLKELEIKNRPMITVLNKVDLCENRLMVDRVRFKYPKTVEISALNKTGFDRLLELMIQEISNLRQTLHLRVPQSEYSLLSSVIRESKIISCEYEENDILLEIEIPRQLMRKVAPFVVPDDNKVNAE
ncbi:MAG TPA: GTPase HflX [Chlamydiales bacterium]|nr:GTPase HflX [Chlamydiales bacterium]